VALSHVACIIDNTGGYRVVVTEHLHHFVPDASRGERCFIHPSLKVEEPVKWELIEWMIQEAELHVLRFVRAANDPEHARFLAPWLKQRDQRWIARLGLAEYCKQYKKFWGRDYEAAL
jgi:hypothetical protein